MSSFLVSILIIALKCNSIYTQVDNLLTCESKETCSECIQDSKCFWCINLKSTLTNHCMDKSMGTSVLCDDEFIVNPKFSVEILEDMTLSSENGKTVQIKPQKMKLSLRKGEEYVLKFQYKQAENYPVDLYYIMDLSASMDRHRERLANLGETLFKSMHNLTSNVKVGFGSFVDKVDLPFVSTVPDKLKVPCTTAKKQPCEPPYSFKNHLSLTEDYKRFSYQVKSSKVSGNLDSPEGGFDAIMQAIVCKDVIGWRDQARHLLIFSTDAEFHIAGDGRLAGVVEPNDAQCHMVNDSYVDALKYDYPSVSHINYIAKKNNVNIIFAIVDKKYVIPSYEMLSNNVENSQTGVLKEDSENVIQLVTDNYNKIVTSVTITSNDSDVKILSSCPNSIENSCSNIHVGAVVDFTATIKPSQCRSDGKNTRTIMIKPGSLDESIEIELTVLCDCECESSNSTFFKRNAPECTKVGDLKCGICDCHSGSSGSNCGCDSTNSDSEDETKCKAKGQTQVCSGFGTCKCEKCVCDKSNNPDAIISGRYCECDNYSCKRKDGELCNGRGSCVCGKCECNSGWMGDICQCPDNKIKCIKPGDVQICSGHGVCDCGQCKCDNDIDRYSGTYCEECPSCKAQNCEKLLDCVECQAYKQGRFNESECRLNCTTFKTKVVDNIDVHRTTDDNKVKNCNSFAYEDRCTITFQYEYLDNDQYEYEVTAAKEKSCISPLYPLYWIFGVIGTIVLAGLILLIIWKVCTSYHDRREYAKFETERQKLKWNRNDNPLYKQATSTFANPVYNRSNSSGSYRLSFRK